MKAKYSQQLKALLKAEEAAAARRNVVQEQLAVTQEWLRVIKEYQALPTLTPEILKQLIKEVRVHSNQSITIAFNFSDPYRSIAELQTAWRGWVRLDERMDILYLRLSKKTAILKTVV